MIVERVEVRLLDLPLVEPFAAAHGVMVDRPLVVVRVETEAGPGWGECSALGEPTYTAEFAAGAFVVVAEILGPLVVGRSIDDLDEALRGVVGHPMAKAAIEMAALDVRLRADGRSLAESLGATATRVGAGAAVGLGSVDHVGATAERLAAAGYRRLKMKIQPGHGHDAVAAIAERVPGTELQVDGNGSFATGDLAELTDLARSGLVTAIEQPFPPDRPDEAVRLVADSPIPIVADEAAPSAMDVIALLDRGAASGVSIKPPRIGGIAPATAVHDVCRDRGVAVTAGGMIESGLGRHALAAVAALDGFTLTGDLSPARRWLTLDPWPDLVLDADGTIAVPTGTGVAPHPDTELVTATTRLRTVVER